MTVTAQWQMDAGDWRRAVQRVLLPRYLIIGAILVTGGVVALGSGDPTFMFVGLATPLYLAILGYAWARPRKDPRAYPVGTYRLQADEDALQLDHPSGSLTVAWTGIRWRRRGSQIVALLPHNGMVVIPRSALGSQVRALLALTSSDAPVPTGSPPSGHDQLCATWSADRALAIRGIRAHLRKHRKGHRIMAGIMGLCVLLTLMGAAIEQPVLVLLGTIATTLWAFLATSRWWAPWYAGRSVPTSTRPSRLGVGPAGLWIEGPRGHGTTSWSRVSPPTIVDGLVIIPVATMIRVVPAAAFDDADAAIAQMETWRRSAPRPADTAPPPDADNPYAAPR